MELSDIMFREPIPNYYKNCESKVPIGVVIAYVSFLVISFVQSSSCRDI